MRTILLPALLLVLVTLPASACLNDSITGAQEQEFRAGYHSEPPWHLPFWVKGGLVLVVAAAGRIAIRRMVRQA